MKRILLIGFAFAGLLSSTRMKAQSFTIEKDTVKFTVNGTTAVPDDITNIADPSGLLLRWKVKDTNFPADWLTSSAFGICDNNTCWNNTDNTYLWNKATSTGASISTAAYVYNVPGTFDLSLNFSSVSIGTYWVTVTITDPAQLPAYSRDATFIITKAPTSVPAVINQEEKVSLYPNPASNELNIVFDASADVKNIAVYNIIGKMMNMHKINGNSTNLNIDNMPSGIYFVKLYNSKGNVVATRKFTKQ